MMSNAATATAVAVSGGTEDPAAPSAPPALPVRKGALARFVGGRSIWALSDQVLISGTNFVTAVLAARALSAAEFGAFSSVYGVLLLCNVFQSTLITQAHNVLGATLKGADYRRYTGSTLFAQAMLAGIQVMLTLPVAIWAYTRGWAEAGMVLALIPAILAWQAQEFVRRVLYTEGRTGDAFANDLIGYGGQTLLIAGLYVGYRSWGTPFTGATPLYALAACCGLAAIVGFWRLRGSVGRSTSTEATQDLKKNWHFGKWLLGAELLGWASSMPMQVWWATWLLGAAASADLRAAQILFGPMRVITFFLATVLPIKFAQALAQQGEAEMRRRVRRVFVLLLPTVGVYCTLLAVFPGPLLRLIYGSEYDGHEAAHALRLYSMAAFLGYVQMVIAAALMSGRQTRYIFAGSVWGCVVALFLSPIFIKAFGAAGGILSIIVTTLVVTGLYVVAYLRNRFVAAAEDRPADMLPLAAEEGQASA